MRVGFFHIALLIFTLAQAARASGMGDDSDKRLVIVESQGSHLSKKAREQLRTAIGDVVTSRGLQLVPSQTLTEKLLRCELPGCLPQIAGATGAMLVLRVEAKYAKESFKLAIDLWNSDEGKLLGRERRDCPICDEQDLWGSAALMAQGLLERALRTPPLAAKTLVPAPAPTVTAGNLVQTPPPSRTPVLRYSGIALAALGAGALATGIYYWSVDGDPAGPDRVRDTRKFGVPMTLAGGAALAAGVGLVAWSFWSGSATVAVLPSGVQVGARF